MLHKVEDLRERRAVRGLHHQRAPLGVVGLKRAASGDGDVFQIASAQHGRRRAHFRALESALHQRIFVAIGGEANHRAAIQIEVRLLTSSMAPET